MITPHDKMAVTHVEGQGPAPSEADIEAAFEIFRAALSYAHRRGSIPAMRKAVAAYDMFAKIIGAN
jgi:hypothetical protein